MEIDARRHLALRPRRSRTRVAAGVLALILIAAGLSQAWSAYDLGRPAGRMMTQWNPRLRRQETWRQTEEQDFREMESLARLHHGPGGIYEMRKRALAEKRTRIARRWATAAACSSPAAPWPPGPSAARDAKLPPCDGAKNDLAPLRRDTAVRRLTRRVAALIGAVVVVSPDASGPGRAARVRCGGSPGARRAVPGGLWRPRDPLSGGRRAALPQRQVGQAMLLRTFSPAAEVRSLP